MDVIYLHGPDRTLLDIDSDGTVSSSSGAPFHGIISRGLLHWLEDRPDGAELWERLAHRLHDGTDADEPALRELRTAADQHQVLSLPQSAEVARRYVAACCEGDVTTCELWNIKEGHTSSVWIVTLAPEGVRFAVNVARDANAGHELRRTSELMRTLSARHPDVRVAEVLDVATVELRAVRELVIVSRNEFVRDALEVHRVNGRFALVERFITSEDAPSRVHAIRGRLLSYDEQTTVDRAIQRVHAIGDPAAHFAIDIDHGDVVWDGHQPVVVALS
jgi:hypothetical protein